MNAPSTAARRGIGRRGAAVIALVALVLAALPPLGRAALIEATSWIDAPLDGAVLPYFPIVVVTHAADQSGVALAILEVDGQPDQTSEEDPPARLVTSRFLWFPPGVGTFHLTARGRNSNGEWGAPATATVLVEPGLPATSVAPSSTATPLPSSSLGPSGSPAGSTSPTVSPGSTTTPTGTPGATPRATPAVTPTPRPTATPTPTFTPAPTSPPTPTPAPTTCVPPAPGLDLPADFFLVLDSSGGNPPLFQWSYGTTPACPPGSFRITIATDAGLSAVQDGATIAAAAGPPWEWIPSRPLPFGRSCTTYYWSVRALAGDGTPGGLAPVRQLAVCP